MRVETLGRALPLGMTNGGLLYYALRTGEPGIFVAFEEQSLQLVANAAAVGARIEEIKGSRKAPGVTEIRVPGEGSYARRDAQREGGEAVAGVALRGAEGDLGGEDHAPEAEGKGEEGEESAGHGGPLLSSSHG